MSWLRNLFAKSDAEADPFAVAGLIAIATFCAAILIATWRDHREPNPWNLGLGLATVLGAIGGGKGLRDKLTPPPAPIAPPAEPAPQPQE